MKRVTVTVPDDLESKLGAYLARHEAPPSITSVMQAALREFLELQQLRERGLRAARKPFNLPPLEEKDDGGEPDVSENHDLYLGESI